MNFSELSQQQFLLFDEAIFSFSSQKSFWKFVKIDRDSREIVGVYVGSRDHIGAQGLWESLPAVYRQCAVCYTDFWAAYNKVLPTKRHHAVGKESGKKNHIGAIWNFVHHYNLDIAPKLCKITTS
jgi:IS1 family transposase